jgi:hypothetical protein
VKFLTVDHSDDTFPAWQTGNGLQISMPNPRETPDATLTDYGLEKAL